MGTGSESDWEGRLQRFMQLSPTANAIVARDGRVLAINPAFTRMLGYTLDDIPDIDHWWRRAYPDAGYRAERQAAWTARVAEAAAGRTVVQQFQGQLTCADGSRRWIETSASLHGEEIYIAMTDLTAHQEAQVALAMEAAYSDALLNAIADARIGLYIIESGRISYANRALCVLLGWQEEEVLSVASFAEIVHQDDREMVLERYRRRLAGEPLPANYDIRLAARGPRERHANVSVTRMSGHRLMVALVEVTDRVIAERTLLETQLQFRTLAESSSEGIFFHDRGRILLATERAADMFGLPVAELLEHRTLDFIAPGYDPPVTRHLGPDAGSARYETRIRRADGNEFPAEISSRPTRFQGREVRIAAVRDISDWKAVREQLEASRDEAVLARQAEAQFFASISHELRTPLHSVIGFAGLGLDECGDGESKLARYFERIRASGERQLALVDDLLDIARLEAGKMDFDLAEWDLRQLIDTVAGEMTPQLAARQQTLTLDLDEAAPPARCDRQRISQVLRNLLSNAVKYGAADSGIRIHLAVAGLDGRPALRVDVSDRGIGVPPGELENIFEKFRQSSRTRTGAGGTGLGLAICREITVRHGGRIWAANNPEGGSTFSLLLPAKGDTP